MTNPTSRDYNKASVLDVVLSHAPLTRNKLIELTGLSKATVSRAVEELRADGFVIDGGVDEVTGRGRRSTYLDLPGTTGHVAGVSFGAQTAGVLVTDLRGREIQHVTVPTVDHQEVEGAARWLVDLIAQAARSAQGPLRQIVVAVPGRVQGGTEIFGPAESMTIFEGSGLQQAVENLIEAPVLLDSDANASLLGILTDDAAIKNAALFSVSTILNFAGCTDRELARGSTPAFGDIGVLSSGVGDESLDELLSTRGLLRFARRRGLDLERIEDLWLQRHTEAPHTEVLQAFTTAIVTAVSVVAVTLDPESVYFVGRLRPLVDVVLPQVRGRLEQSLPAVPEIRTGPHRIGLSTAQGAVYACLTIAQERLRDAVLGARQQNRLTEQSAPAF
ncbi:ROK family transcriptional regulator [Streptomyces europaeiscabiei]|uniref:ROK family transcriptional regulator n=1 Tax=Streptomyces europaeiscabiei TaxID=146819 RepID=UPI0029A4CDED|nr:ROK family transcriptional regulator [Streptomyces europaeiscabiei]MDX2531249.1 ROK family transcriptional regulator [Streptomyces europaeiscabiei]MDX3781860.1 ROK family transcriptional regulator [Streptomyces europaeiscabiei]MDX3837801.1 ROK family transcriptional regulator [Streptomyces europaeiscabiei]